MNRNSETNKKNLNKITKAWSTVKMKIMKKLISQSIHKYYISI